MQIGGGASMAEIHGLVKAYTSEDSLFILEEYNTRKSMNTALSSALSSLVIGPLFTMATSLQLSQKKATPQLSRLVHSQMLAEKMASITRKGVSEKSSTLFKLPFQSAYYSSYSQVFSGLRQEGLRGFYKGNLIRCVYVFFYQTLRLQIQEYMPLRFMNFSTFLSALLTDLLLKPLHSAESQFILQNGKKQFAVHRSLGGFLKSGRSFYNGLLMLIPRNFFISLADIRVFSTDSMWLLYLQHFIVYTMAYPFLTLQRLREVDCNHWFFETNNSRYRESIKQIYKERGIWRGFYRGYGLYMFAFLSWLSIVPTMSETLTMQSPLFRRKQNREEQLLKIAEEEPETFDD